jgi:hypothetical protein
LPEIAVSAKIVPDLVRHEFDWGAVEAGLATGEPWFTYQWIGRESLQIDVSTAIEEGRCDIRIHVHAETPYLAEKIQAAWLVFQSIRRLAGRPTCRLTKLMPKPVPLSPDHLGCLGTESRAWQLV